MTDPAANATPAAHGHAIPGHAHVNPDDHHPHVVPMWQLTAVILTLILFTVVTVVVAKITPNVPLAMGIATVKGALVCLYFMHLRWDKPFNSLVFLISVAFLALFLGFSCFDTGQYQGSIDASYSQTKMEELRKADQAARGATAHH